VGLEELINKQFFIKICLISIITINWQKEKYHHKTREDILTAQYFLLIIKQQQTITVKKIQFLLLVTATILNGRGLSQF
jgi:hypothetical protein